MGAFRLDATLLQAWKGPVAGGMYGIAYRFFEPALFLGWSISAAALPRMTREHVRGERPKTLELSITLLLAVYLPLALGAPFAARFVVDKLFSDRYLPAVNAVTWLVGASLFYSLAHLGRVAAISLGQRGRITLISATTLVGNLVANVFVIPRYSFTGAAVVTFFTEVAEAALLGLLLVRNERRLRFSRLAFVPIIAGLSMLFVLVVSGQRGDDAVLLGAPVYVVSLLAAGWVIDVDTMRAFGRLLRRQPPEPSLAHSALPDE
jgi:O-antigen/teichoic acid export membrane protein